MNWQKDSEVKLQRNVALKDKTTFRIGGRAKFFCRPKDWAELKSLLAFARKNKLPFYILGSGSNLLVSDKGLKALVIKLDAPFFRKIEFQGNRVKVGSGLPLGTLVQKCAQQGLSGAEVLAGIPGTVGGALIMNAGAWGGTIGKIVEEVRVMDYNGKLKNLRKSALKFAYRKSNLDRYIILAASLRLAKKNKADIRKDIRQYLGNRRYSQDNAYPNAGCIFRNPAQGLSAGRLIDLCGLKGKCIGAASISSRHANFILNKGNASAKDVLRLMELARKKVKNKFKIKLDEEVKIWK